jgi:hypothetical protein
MAQGVKFRWIPLVINIAGDCAGRKSGRCRNPVNAAMS